MNANSKTNRRRIHYIDVRLQRWLIVGLCGVQLLGVGLVLLYLDNSLRDVLEANLYRIHLRPGSDVQALVLALIKAMGLLLLINVLALAIADWLWSSHLRETLDEFRLLIRRTANLDLAGGSAPADGHELLRRFEQWRDRERRLCLAVNAGLDELQNDKALSVGKARRAVQDARRLLAARLHDDQADQSGG